MHETLKDVCRLLIGTVIFIGLSIVVAIAIIKIYISLEGL